MFIFILGITGSDKAPDDRCDRRSALGMLASRNSYVEGIVIAKDN